MSDLIDRTELRRILRDNGLYSTAVRQVVEAAPAVEDEATRLIKEMQADLLSVARLNDTMRQTIALLIKENQHLKMELDRKG